jgi:hypothetical protein
MIAIIVIIVLSVFLSGNNNSNDKINATTNTTNTTTVLSSSTEKPTFSSNNKIERRQKLLEILALLSDDPFNKQDYTKQDYTKSTNHIDAFNWLVDDDIVTTTIFSTANNDSHLDFDLTLIEKNEWKIRQRYILALLYFSTNGQSWDEQHDFLSSNLDECDWTFVGTEDDWVLGDNTTGVTVEGVICNKQGRVERLRMGWNSMSGT